MPLTEREAWAELAHAFSALTPCEDGDRCPSCLEAWRTGRADRVHLITRVRDTAVSSVLEAIDVLFLAGAISEGVAQRMRRRACLWSDEPAVWCQRMADRPRARRHKGPRRPRP
jgi:pyrimidine deaminase RibD-like protein